MKKLFGICSALVIVFCAASAPLLSEPEKVCLAPSASPTESPTESYGPPTPGLPVLLVGVASWYDATKNNAWYTRKTKWFKGTLDYAAAGQELRAMIEAIWPGHRYWHGNPIRAKITNTKTGISVIVYITDTCGCYSGTPSDRSDDKIIDLSPKVFKALGVSLSRGIQKVTVEILR